MPIYRFEKYLLCRAFSEVYRSIGNGFSKPVYLEALAAELELHNIPFVRSPELTLSYKSVPLKQFYIPDFLCFDKILVMIKASRQLSSELIQQFCNSVGMTSKAAGYLVNFGAFPQLQCIFELSLPSAPHLPAEDNSVDKSPHTATLTTRKPQPQTAEASAPVRTAIRTTTAANKPRQTPRLVQKHTTPPSTPPSP